MRGFIRRCCRHNISAVNRSIANTAGILMLLSTSSSTAASGYPQRREIIATADTAASVYDQLRTNPLTGPNEWIPEVVVTDIEPKFTSPDLSLRRRLREWSAKYQEPALVQSRAAQFGLTYRPNVIADIQRDAFVDAWREYVKLFGLQNEEGHYIQRETRNIADRFGLRDSIARALALDSGDASELASELSGHPLFNYYPEPTTRFSAHFDNMFAGEEVVVLNLGAPYWVRFTPWVCSTPEPSPSPLLRLMPPPLMPPPPPQAPSAENPEFLLLVEPNVLYRMSGRVRYDYVHSGVPVSARPAEPNLGASTERLSLVWSRKHFKLGGSSPLHVFGEYDNRLAWEKAFRDNRRCSLHSYLKFVHDDGMFQLSHTSEDGRALEAIIPRILRVVDGDV